MVTIFGRYDAPNSRSIALRRFNSSETEVNKILWSHVVESSFCSKLARDEIESNKSCLTRDLFKAFGADAERIPLYASDWLKGRRMLENWLYISILVSAISYLEVYMKRIFITAIMSDPMLLLGVPRALDGGILLKEGKNVDFDKKVEALTKGAWDSRNSALSKIFGQKIDFIEANVGDLEEMRKIRNIFAHGFGREIDSIDITKYELEPFEKLSKKRLKDYLGIISKTAAKIDEYLLREYIGAFELLAIYNEKKRGGEFDRMFGAEVAKKIKKIFRSEYNLSLNEKYCSDLIAYYNSI